MSQPSGLTGSLPEPTPTDRRLGRYRLAYELASGGMATLFMACSEGAGGFDKVVALKRIHPHLAHRESYVEMFLDEARLASRLTHPNVCGVIDFGQHEDAYFLVMELLLGVPLNRLLMTLAREPNEGFLAREPDWPTIACRLATDAAEGLHAAHELRDARGELLHVVHRDVSPHNLFVGFDGALRVLDFGIAKAEGRLHRTNTGELKGKFAYMAPEQIRHEAVDRRADVWALGVVLWEMLTRRRLFKRTQEIDTMYAILEGEILPPSRYANVPPELDDLVLAALARDPAERLPDARTFGRELMRIHTSGDRQPAHAADVAELLRELYPGEEARQRGLVELARQQRGSVPKVGLAPDQSGSFSGLHTSTLEPEVAAANPPKRRWLIPAILFSLVGLAAGGAVGWSLSTEEPADEGAAAPRVDVPEAPAAVAPPVERTELEPAAAEPAREPSDVVTQEDAPSPTERAERSAAARRRAARRARRAEPERRAESPPEPETPAEIPEPATASTGRVAVVVPGGWANVYDARGGFLGATPLTTELPVGRQRLQLRFNGEPPPVSVVVDVPAGGTVRLTRQPPR